MKFLFHFFFFFEYSLELIEIFFSILGKHELNEPKIAEDNLRHVTRGQILRVNCTTIVETDMNYVLNWSTPHMVGK